jgi:hypothetical protein
MSVSRRQAQRLARAAAAAQQQQPELPEELTAAIDRYEPLGVDPDVWAAVRADYRDTMVRSGARTPGLMTKFRQVLGPYLVWRHRQGLDCGRDAAMTFAEIDDYYRRRLTAGPERVSDASANDYRARLRRIARSANPGDSAPTTVTIGHIPVRPGYSAAEEAAIRRVALRQRRSTQRRRMCALVGLAVGAGLAPEDFRALLGGHVADLGEDGIRVDVPGANARTTWVRRDYEELVRIGIAGVARGDLVLGRDVNRRNITTRASDRAELSDCPPIDAYRLLNTWLSWLMCQPVPVKVVLDAAGLGSARTLTDLLPHLPEPGADSDRMRGVTR